MNPFLVYDSDVSSYRQTGILTTGGVGSRRGADNSAVTDALALRAAALEGRADALEVEVDALEVEVDALPRTLEVRLDAVDVYVASLVESIRILQDVSYINIAFNAYTETARRVIPYPSYVQISTIDASSTTSGGVSSTTSTRILNTSGDLVASAVASVDDVWQIVPTGGRNITISAPSSVDLAQKYGKTYLDILSTDGGITFHIGQPGAVSLGVWSGSFLTHTDGSATLSATTYTSTALLRASNRWRLSLVPNYTPPVFTATELTRQLFQAKQPSAAGNYAFTMWSYAASNCYVQQKAMVHDSLGAHKWVLGISDTWATDTYPLDTWNFLWMDGYSMFTIYNSDLSIVPNEDVFLGRLKQPDGEFSIRGDGPQTNPGPSLPNNYYQDTSRAFSDMFDVEYVTNTAGDDKVFKISQTGSSLKAEATAASVLKHILFDSTPTTNSLVSPNDEFWFILWNVY